MEPYSEEDYLSDDMVFPNSPLLRDSVDYNLNLRLWDESLAAADVVAAVDLQQESVIQERENVPSTSSSNGPYLEFVEEPGEGFRFRYESEMTGTHGCITGKSSDRGKKKLQQYPTVRVRNVSDETIIVRCSLNQADVGEDYFKPHAHRLLFKRGKKEVSDDPHEISVCPKNQYTAIFRGMGIIHTAKKGIKKQLHNKITRLYMEHLARSKGAPRQLTNDDLTQIEKLIQSARGTLNPNVVSLRFDAFRKVNGILYPICEPLYSSPIKNLKSAETGMLKICRRSICSGYASGETEVFLLVEKINKAGINIRFYELDDDAEMIWEDHGKFSPLDIHHQYAIVFRTPRYHNQSITSSVTVFMQLVRISDGETSEPLEFKYIPNPVYARKRRMIEQKNQPLPYPSIKKKITYEDSEPTTSIHIMSDPLLSSSSATVNTTCPLPERGIPVSFSDEQVAAAIEDPASADFVQIYAQFGGEYEQLEQLEINEPQRQDDVEIDSTSRSLVDSYTNATVLRPYENTSLMTAERMLAEVKSFLKTKYSNENAVQMLHYYLGVKSINKYLHDFLVQEKLEEFLFILQLIIKFKQFELLNIKNEDSQTLLHLAVMGQHYDVIKLLLKCKVDLSLTDNDGNTALHLAVQNDVPMNILDLLLSEDDKDVIDATNNSGDTALLIAVEQNNLEAVKYLHENGADIIKRNEKTHFTPILRAITKQYQEIVKYIVSLYDEISDMELLQDQPEVDFEFVEFEEEIDPEANDTSPPTEIDNSYTLFPTEIITAMYKNVNTFTPECLSDVTKILSESKKWRDIADHFGLGHMIRSGLIEQAGADFIRKLLVFAEMKTGGNMLDIRQLLQQLNEVQAVKALDMMAFEKFNELRIIGDKNMLF